MCRVDRALQHLRVMTSQWRSNVISCRNSRSVLWDVLAHLRLSVMSAAPGCEWVTTQDSVTLTAHTAVQLLLAVNRQWFTLRLCAVVTLKGTNLIRYLAAVTFPPEIIHQRFPTSLIFNEILWIFNVYFKLLISVARKFCVFVIVYVSILIAFVFSA